MANQRSQSGPIGRAAEIARTINRLQGEKGEGGVWGVYLRWYALPTGPRPALFLVLAL